MPKVTEIIVSAGRTFNHPHESYSNLRPQVTMKAEVLPGEDPCEVAKALQAQAEGLVEDHKQSMLNSIEELYELSETQARIAGLRSTIERAQQQLNDARKGLPAPLPMILIEVAAHKKDPWHVCQGSGCARG